MNRLSKWPAILWTGLIFVLLVIPSEGIPNPGLLRVPHMDKMVHALLFGIFVWLWFVSIPVDQKHGNQPGKPLHLFLLSAGYGILMEFVQAGFTNRAFEKLDILADITGAGLAWLFIHFSHQRKK